MYLLSHPNFTSGSQKIFDFLGVALQVQKHGALFAPLKRVNLPNFFLDREAGVITNF
jgi:hypothetical protein